MATETSSLDPARLNAIAEVGKSPAGAPPGHAPIHLGTAFLVHIDGDDAYLATACHVLYDTVTGPAATPGPAEERELRANGDLEHFRVRFYRSGGGTREWITAYVEEEDRLQGSERTKDWAILRVSRESIGDRRPLTLSTWIPSNHWVSFGFPEGVGGEGKWNHGTIGTYDDPMHLEALGDVGLETPGISGSPLFVCGHVVGIIVKSLLRGGQNVGGVHRAYKIDGLCEKKGWGLGHPRHLPFFRGVTEIGRKHIDNTAVLEDLCEALSYPPHTRSTGEVHELIAAALLRASVGLVREVLQGVDKSYKKPIFACVAASQICGNHYTRVAKQWQERSLLLRAIELDTARLTVLRFRDHSVQKLAWPPLQTFEALPGAEIDVVNQLKNYIHQTGLAEELDECIAVVISGVPSEETVKELLNLHGGVIVVAYSDADDRDLGWLEGELDEPLEGIATHTLRKLQGAI